MAAKISNITELFHRFHQCEMQVKQGKIAPCLIAFREIIERMPSVPKTEKEKKELNEGIEFFLKNLSAHKKFQEIFGVVSFGDTDLETNLEFIKSMIIAQEEEIVERVKKEEEALEAQRLEIDQEKQRQLEEMNLKIQQVIEKLDQNDVPGAMEIINESEEIREAVALHYNTAGMHSRAGKAFEESIQAYKKALIVSPEDENLHYNMGRAYFESGRADKAEKCLTRAMKINPDFKEGEAFYHYLLKMNHPVESKSGEPKPGGFLKKLLGK